MFTYSINVQHALDTAFFDEQSKEVIKKGVEFYNTKSRCSRNSKEIVEYSYIDDNKTLVVILQSQLELPVPGKALKLLSQYLANDVVFSNRIYAKRLFRMDSQQISKENNSNYKSVLLIRQISELLLNGDIVSNLKIKQIEAIVFGEGETDNE